MVTVQDPDFLVPDASLAGDTVNSPSVSPWSWGGGSTQAGVASRGSYYYYFSPLVPTGLTQVGFLTSTPSSAGLTFQSLNFGAGGQFTFSLSLLLIDGADSDSTLVIEIDGSSVATAPALASWATVTTAALTLAAGSHTLGFTLRSSASGGVLISGIAVSDVTPPPPAVNSISRPARWLPRPRMR